MAAGQPVPPHPPHAGPPPAPPVRIADGSPDVIGVAARLVIAAIVITALYFGSGLLQPLAFAMLLGFLLAPAVTRLTRAGLPRMLSVLLVTVAALGALTAVGVYLTTQVRSLGEELPAYQDTIRTKVRDLRAELRKPGVLDPAASTLAVVQEEMTDDDAAPPPERVEVVEPEQQALATAGAWLDRVSGPAATVGIVILFVVLLLLDRGDLRDRLFVVVGADLHRATDAMSEASERIGKYLRMQLAVNVSYGVPMAVGLWWLGIPSALLWGALATIMRFVPYVGPVIGAAFPLLLAFAVDPGWQIFALTAGLIVGLELVSNNVIEPWLYGESTGLSPLAIIVAATFWTAVWGPIGLVLSTPLTVCLFVLGRYIEPLRFFRVLLGSEPVMPMSERLYQRLIAGDTADAVDLATTAITAALPRQATPADTTEAVIQFYDAVGIATLRFASEHHRDVARTEHRLRVASGFEALLTDIEARYPAPPRTRPGAVVCLGARWEVDGLAARMLTHALSLEGYAAETGPIGPAGVADLDTNVTIVCLSSFSPQSAAQLRLLANRVRRRVSHARILAAAWNLPADIVVARPQTAMDAEARSIQEVVQHLDVQTHGALEDGAVPAPIRADDDERTSALRASGVLDPALTAAYHDAAVQAANVFDVDYAQISWVDRDEVHTPGTLVPSKEANGPADSVPRTHTVCSYVVHDNAPVVVEDIARDPRFANNPRLATDGIRFYAGVPLRDAQGRAFGSFCILDKAPRVLAPNELEVLETIAADIMEHLPRDSERTGFGTGSRSM